jgi:phosphatidylglycerol lysyltransferase
MNGVLDKLTVIVRRFLPFIALALFGAALLVLRHELRVHSYHEIVRYLGTIPARAIVEAALLTLLSYFVLSRYDMLALRYAGVETREPRTSFVAFISYGLSHTLGWAMFTGGAVRIRVWSSWGLTGEQLARAMSFQAVTFWLGVLTIGGASLAVEPALMAQVTPFNEGVIRAIGLLLLAVVAAYVGLALSGRRSVRIGSWTFPLPRPHQAAWQLAVSCTDWIVASSVLYVLLPPTMAISFPALVGAFVLGQVSGIISHIPGGVGVFDTIVLVVLGQQSNAAHVFGILLAYRAIYYLVPFAGALILLAGRELLERRHLLGQAARLAGRWVPDLAPLALSTLTFLGGVVLLVSGATPELPARLLWLHRILPLALIETAHFLGSLAGAGLIVLAWGLRRRLDAAYSLVVLLLGLGAVASLAKGFDYEEAIVLAVIFGLVLPARPLFHRKAALLAEPFSPGWLVAMGVVIVGVFVIGEFSYKHVQYGNDLWWRFTLHGDAPRFLRATLGAVGLLCLVGLVRLLRPARLEPVLPDTAALDRAFEIYRHSSRTYGALALLGDKALLMSESGKGFLMYAVSGRSWVAMGDPVGPPDDQEELVWTFLGLVDRHGGWPVFYEVTKDCLPLYIDSGLSLAKLGEEARVPLGTLSMEGSNRRGLRRTLRQVEKEGCTFKLLERDQVPAVLPELEAISDQWLAEKHTREKGFSLGFFDPAYLRYFRVATVERDGKIMAFANLWEGAFGTEIAIDLMRQGPDAPAGAMDFLLLHLMFWGKEQGYQWMSLGMAPLAGLESHTLAPLWHRVGTLLFQHGERFYNFRGLRSYKEKFDPVWDPRYLVSPGGLVLPRTLANVATLISDGWRGLFGR